MASPTQQQHQQQRIFITGATGYIGTLVTTLALRAGHAVHALSRSARGTQKLLSLGATPVPGTLTSLDVLHAEAAAADAVIHLADAWVDDFAQPYDDVVAIDNAAIDAITSGLARSRSQRKLLIDTSGAGVVMPAENDAETDESALENPSPMNGRIRCEKYALSKAGGEEGVRVCVVRLPPFVYGRGGSGVRLFMGEFARLGFVARVGDGRIRTCAVHVDDAARAYVLALERACGAPGVVRDVFNVTATTEVSFRELTDAVAATMGLPVREMEKAEAVATAGPLIAGFFSDRIRAASGKARRELGWVPTEVGILEDIRNGSYVEVAKELKGRAGEQV